MSPTIARFSVTSDADLVYRARDGDVVWIVEHLPPLDGVDRVNDEVEGAVDAADPDEALFNPIMQAFHGPCTKQVAGMPGISRTFATDVMCHPLLLAICDRGLL